MVNYLITSREQEFDLSVPIEFVKEARKLEKKPELDSSTTVNCELFSRHCTAG